MLVEGASGCQGPNLGVGSSLAGKGDPAPLLPPSSGGVISCWTLHPRGVPPASVHLAQGRPWRGGQPPAPGGGGAGAQQRDDPPQTPPQSPQSSPRGAGGYPAEGQRPNSSPKLPRAPFQPPGFATAAGGKACKQPTSSFLCCSLLSFPPPTWRGNLLGVGGRSPHTLSCCCSSGA